MSKNRILYSLIEAFKQIVRNKGMALASFLSITAILIILGLFLSIIVNVNNLAEMIKQDFSTVEVYLKDDVDENGAQLLGSYMEDMPEVMEVSYKPKEEAFKEMKEKWGNRGYMLDDRKDSFPNALIVKVKTLKDANSFAKKAGEIKGVEQVLNSSKTVKKLISVTNYIEIAGLAIIITLIIVSVLVVSNTIKLTVLARNEEITIMKNVGATNWLIRGPFLFEGMLIGLFAAIVGSSAIWLIYHNIAMKIGRQMIVMFSTDLVSESFMMNNLIVIFVALGISVGAVGSLISIRKFLET
jgi:cell division transport system permease protein